MYNRYIPEEEFGPLGEEEEPERRDGEDRGAAPPPRGGREGGPGPDFPGLGRLGELFSGEGSGGVGRLLSALRLDDLDSGDVLLLLIILFLLVEGDNLELVIALGLVLIMGLGDRGKEKG